MSNQNTAWSPVPIRFIIGIGFIYHGAIKLFSGAGHEMFVRMLNDIGIPAATVASWLVGLVEFAGGIAILLGTFLSIASIVLIIDMLVAMFMVNLPNGFDVMNVTVMIEAGPTYGMPGFEINLLYIAGLVSLLLTGAGNWSLDVFRSKSPEAPVTES